jgi:hypothetical protein
MSKALFPDECVVDLNIYHILAPEPRFLAHTNDYILMILMIIAENNRGGQSICVKRD